MDHPCVELLFCLDLFSSATSWSKQWQPHVINNGKHQNHHKTMELYYDITMDHLRCHRGCIMVLFWWNLCYSLISILCHKDTYFVLVHLRLKWHKTVGYKKKSEQKSPPFQKCWWRKLLIAHAWSVRRFRAGNSLLSWSNVCAINA